jgi:serine/threonine protein kinase
VTSQKFSLDSPRGDNYGFVYAPGRTFPYAPPETSNRIDKFSSQQDMFSFGVIMFQFLFNSFPLNCSESVLKTIYKSKEYTERIFLAPEKAEYYG